MRGNMTETCLRVYVTHVAAGSLGWRLPPPPPLSDPGQLCPWIPQTSFFSVSLPRPSRARPYLRRVRSRLEVSERVLVTALVFNPIIRLIIPKVNRSFCCYYAGNTHRTTQRGEKSCDNRCNKLAAQARSFLNDSAVIDRYLYGRWVITPEQSAMFFTQKVRVLGGLGVLVFVSIVEHSV